MALEYPIYPVNNFGKSSCAYWEEFLTQQDIDYLLQLCDRAPTDAMIGYGAGILDKKIRSTKLNWLEFINENKHIYEKISTVVGRVNSRFFQYDLDGFYERGQLGIYAYEENGHYDWHIDSGYDPTAPPRKLSICILLSDPSEFEGGELLLKTDRDAPISLEMKKGRAWFFPSYMLHKVTPVTKGIRKSLVLWVSGPDFK